MCGRWNKKNALKVIYVYVLYKLELNTTKSNKKQHQKKKPKTAAKTPLRWRCFSSFQKIEVSLFFFQKNVKHIQFYNYLVYIFFTHYIIYYYFINTFTNSNCRSKDEQIKNKNRFKAKSSEFILISIC